MKVNPIQSLNTNPYKKAVETNIEKRSQAKSRDKLEISSEAKGLLQGSEWQQERDKKVNALKQLIESGNYRVNYAKTAEKLLEQWKI